MSKKIFSIKPVSQLAQMAMKRGESLQKIADAKERVARRKNEGQKILKK